MEEPGRKQPETHRQLGAWGQLSASQTWREWFYVELYFTWVSPCNVEPFKMCPWFLYHCRLSDCPSVPLTSPAMPINPGCTNKFWRRLAWNSNPNWAEWFSFSLQLRRPSSLGNGRARAALAVSNSLYGGAGAVKQDQRTWFRISEFNQGNMGLERGGSPQW